MLVFLFIIPFAISALSPAIFLKSLQIPTPSQHIHDSLVKACRFSDHDKIYALLSQKADVNYTDSNGFTPLYWVIKNEDKYGLQILLNHHVDVNQDIEPEDAYLKRRGNKKNSPLFCAIISRNITTIHMLLKAGADPNIEYQDGWTCLTFAIWYTYYDAIYLLFKIWVPMLISLLIWEPLSISLVLDLKQQDGCKLHNL